MNIELGVTVKCMVSGFTGTVVGRVEYLNGCRQYLIRPRAKKGENKHPEGVWLDEELLVVTGEGVADHFQRHRAAARAIGADAPPPTSYRGS